MSAFRGASLLLCLACLWIALAAVANEPPRIQIKSPGIAAGAPADWWILVTLEPKPEHREVILEAHGEPGEYRRSDIEVAGEKAWKLRQFWYKSLGEGCYRFSATVTDGTDDDAVVLARVESQPLAVIGHSGYPCPDRPF